MWPPIYPAPPVTKTVMPGPRSYFEIVAAFAHRNIDLSVLPENKRRKFCVSSVSIVYTTSFIL